MGNPPWLDSLSDDWVPVPATPTSPIPSRSLGHSRRSSLQSLPGSPSRIPVPARRSLEPSSPVDPKKKVTRPCHFVRREPPTPKTPRTPRTRPRQSPVPDKSKPSPRPTPNRNSNPPSRRKQKQPAMDTRSPLRSVSNVSNQSGQQSTVQVRRSKGKGKDGTPEWRKRLVHGEISAGEQRDLFAPIGLESVFDPPTPSLEKEQHKTIPNMKQADDIWDFNATDLNDTQEVNDHMELGDNLPATNNNDQSRVEGSHPNDSELPENHTESRDNAKPSETPPESPTGTVEIKGGLENIHLNPNENRKLSQNDTQLRSASGLEDLRNEGITPITFSRNNTVDGTATSEVIRSALKQVTNKLERLSMAPRERPGSRASDSMLLNQQADVPTDALQDDDLLDVTSHSLPQDLSMGTLDYRGRGAFAKLGRDQFLSEASFHRRQFSPPSFPSHRLSPFLQANPSIRSSPPFFQRQNPLTDPPTLPRPSSAQAQARTYEQTNEDKNEVMPSSGSPLKLFGAHDTFTNNKLLRRMSQFEETFGGLSEEDEPVSPSEEARRKGENRSFLNVNHDVPGDLSARRHERPWSRNRATPRLSRFGDGELDNFDFSDASPYESKLLNHESGDSNNRPTSRRRRYLQRNSYNRESEAANSNFSGSVKPTPRSASPPRESATENENSPINEDAEEPEMQWAPNSPAKDPNPKRRRTFMRSHSSRNIEENGVDSQSAQQLDDLSLLQRSLMQHGVRYDDNDSLLRPPSSTQRPRTPTPSQIRSSARKRSSTNRHLPLSDHGDFEHEGSPAEGTVPKVKVTAANEETRKGSITTQDFLSEATKIMDMIRSKGRNAGGLSSVEESESEDKNESQSYEDESTREEFSRPPSRDGVDIRKLREPKEQNPRILSHLKKFQEKDDLEFGANASVMSLHLDDDPAPPGELDGGSDLGNQPTHGNASKRKLSSPTSGEDDSLRELLTINTDLSAKSFSARSIPTGSSQSSHAKGVLSSNLVSHLIPEQVNGLTYDRCKHQWIKENPEKPREKPKGEENSEDDPFQDIPDLSVDELQEMMRMQSSLSPEKAKDSTLAEDSIARSPLSAKAPSPKAESRPQTKDGDPSVNVSSVQSKLSHFTSSYPHSGTRATSWGSERPKSREFSSEVEHEIQLHEGRLSKPPRRQNNGNQQARVVTISFSSPLASQITYSDDESPTKLRRGERITNSSEEAKSTEDAGDNPKPTPSPLLQPDQPFLRRSISRIDERGEETAEGLSLIRRNMQGAELTPVKDNEGSLVSYRNYGQDTTYSFHLSPLPDFTVEQIDQSLQLEVSYVAQRTHPTSLRQVHGTFALATEELVKHITEVEPFEPYWEHVRRLVLRHKGLITLHKLCDFCPRLEDLDVSNNNIGQLSGIPSTLRTLTIQQNSLSNLTAWGHLTNLQYVDVSGNELESLDGFSNLIHLRELKANDNNIRNIDGVFDLDGLLSLKLKNNSLTAVDFGGAELNRLQELDLSHNQLMSVRNIGSLSSLSKLDLSYNTISQVDSSTTLPGVRSLKLSNNQLHSLDVSPFPYLNLLYVDQNLLTTVEGLGECHGLEILSAREQMINEQNSGFFDVDLGLVKDARKVFLSSNRLSLQCLSPSVPLSGLQLLDLASCSIQSLPADFALHFPNVKVLNLNYNSLSSVNELAAMNCLSRLAIAGNCIARLRRLCQVLSRIGRTNKSKTSTLHKLDIRGNPLTVRFYPPAVTGNGRKEKMKNLKEAEEEPAQVGKMGLDIPSVLADFARHGDMDHLAAGEEVLDMPEQEVEINDPYTLPPADFQADQRYLSRLDEPTRLRRRVFELMLYAGTGGSIRFLDGLEFHPALEEGSDMDHAWTKLEKLGVLKKKAITA